ncbi:MAG: ATP-dependent sacrificial sulfur transferase LarE [Carboxylicivirga sp.]|jgi:uncharacterized protein|nr:ATP-dependent sacrificial sulfur transferase LarE [Carboxylicivirga sp.]
MKKLEHWFEEIDASITAFSGGIDSALVLYLSKQFLGDNAFAVVGVSPSLKMRDKQLAIDFCEQHSIQLELIETNELENADYSLNPIDRCYHCKSTLYNHIIDLGQKFPGHTILNGTNIDDLGDYRPGLMAAREKQVRSPLAECKIGKAELRMIAKRLGIKIWNKAASPCLSSRIPYNETITKEKLNRIEKAEEILIDLGFKDCRVRHFETGASIEVPPSSIETLLNMGIDPIMEIKHLGFNKVVIDSEGLISGKLNRAIKNETTLS